MGPQPHYGYYGEHKKGLNWKVALIIFGGLVLLIAGIAIVASLSGRNGIGTQSQHLNARLTNLVTLTTDAAKKLDSDDLQKVNAEASLLTAGTQTDLASILPKKTDKSIIAAENDTAVTSDLANAALAGTYDATYKAAMTAKLESITDILSEMIDKTGSKTTRATLTADYDNYQALLINLGKVTV